MGQDGCQTDCLGGCLGIDVLFIAIEIRHGFRVELRHKDLQRRAELLGGGGTLGVGQFVFAEEGLFDWVEDRVLRAINVVMIAASQEGAENVGGTDKFLAEGSEFGLKTGVGEGLALREIEVFSRKDNGFEFAVAFLAQFLKFIQTVEEGGGSASLEDNSVVVDEQARFGENIAVDVARAGATYYGAFRKVEHRLPFGLADGAHSWRRVASIEGDFKSFFRAFEAGEFINENRFKHCAILL